MIPSHRVFCDTGFLYATLAHGDRHYDRAGELLEECSESHIELCSTWEIVSETVTLFTYRFHSQAAIEFLDAMKPVLTLIPTTQTILDEAEQVFRTHVRTRQLSFCDAVSFVVVTTLLDNIPCMSFDPDFQALGLTVLR